MNTIKRRNRVYDTGRFGQPEIRMWHRKARGKTAPRYTLVCGCCDQRLEIYYSEDGLEIGGINGALEDWREILLPVLQIEHRQGIFVDASIRPSTKRRKR